MKPRRASFAFFLLWCLWVASGCSAPAADENTLRVSGAVDTLPLIAKAVPGFSASSGLTLVPLTSRAPLQALQSGEAEAAILGRELSEEESREFQSTLIARDAICILISTRTAAGGMEQGLVGGMGGRELIQPRSKFEGLKELSLDEIRQLYANVLKINDEQNFWILPGNYLTFQPYTLGDTLAPKEDPDNPGHAMGMWVWNAVPLNSELTPDGMVDAQQALLQKLGFAGVDLSQPGIGYVPLNIASEEEWISSRYDIAPGLSQEVSTYPFSFYLMAASRQVTLRALQHEFKIHALLIDGVDPLDPESIYSGTYPLDRNIYLVTRRSTPDAQVNRLQDYLLSVEGQRLIEEASFLPLRNP
jgi:hypothetical protein